MPPPAPFVVDVEEVGARRAEAARDRVDLVEVGVGVLFQPAAREAIAESDRKGRVPCACEVEQRLGARTLGREQGERVTGAEVDDRDFGQVAVTVSGHGLIPSRADNDP